MRIEKTEVPMDSELPFNFFNFYPLRKQYDSEGIRGYHWHESFEIAYIVKGCGKYIFKDKEYEICAGDIIVINNTKPHFFDVEEDIHIQIIAFVPSLIWSGSAIDSEYLKPFLGNENYYFSKISEEDSYYEEILANFNHISNEFDLRLNGYKMAIKAHLQLMLTYLIRNLQEDDTKNIKPGHKNWLEDIETVQRFLQENYSSEITLTQAASMLHLTNQYFSTMFKKATGVSFIEYLNRYRIHKAIEFLCSNNYKITEIASLCGFSNVTHFNRVFKQHTGQSPSNFKSCK